MASVREYLRNIIKNHITDKVIDSFKYEQMAFYLRNLSKTINEKGVSDERYFSNDVIVSLTSYGNRINEVYLTIESIMQQTVKPNKIVLWLDYGMKDVTLPSFLKKQLQRGLEIRYCEDIRSYKKLIPSLKEFPNDIIVTIDDDLLYEPDILERLLESYRKNPEAISSCRNRRIIFDKYGNITSYKFWLLNNNHVNTSLLNLINTGGGTLFPPHVLDEEVMNSSAFMSLCPLADDIWISFMAVLKGSKIKKVYTHSVIGEDYVENKGVQSESLFSINMEKNDVQIKAILNEYNILPILREAYNKEK